MHYPPEHQRAHMLVNGIQHHNGVQHLMMHSSAVNGMDVPPDSASSPVMMHQNPNSGGISANASSVVASNNSPATVTVYFVCQPRSHTFQERWIPLSASNGDNNDVSSLNPPPVKVGRLVARVKPAADNAIFDCKVLSRNHALLWQDEAGRVWLKDTKSSNGTFVNGQRLSKGGEESGPRELFTGDIVQFGVEVVESQLTHGCIISQVTIFNSDGSERKRKVQSGAETHLEYPGAYRQAGNANPLSQYGMNVSGYGPNIGSVMTQEQLFQITHYIQEAWHREQALEKKMHSMQEVMQDIVEASEATWQVILNEQKLMSKVRSLEEVLSVYTENFGEDGLRCRLVRAVEARQAIEEKLQTLLDSNEQDRLFLLNKLSDCELQFAQRDDECNFLRQKCSELEMNYTQLSRSYEERGGEMEELRQQMKSMEEQLSQAQKNYCHMQESQQQQEPNHEELLLSHQQERDLWLQREHDYQDQIQHLCSELEDIRRMVNHTGSNHTDHCPQEMSSSNVTNPIDNMEVLSPDVDVVVTHLRSDTLRNVVLKHIRTHLKSDSLQSSAHCGEEQDVLEMLDMAVEDSESENEDQQQLQGEHNHQQELTQHLTDYFATIYNHIQPSSSSVMQILDAFHAQLHACFTLYDEELNHLRVMRSTEIPPLMEDSMSQTTMFTDSDGLPMTKSVSSLCCDGADVSSPMGGTSEMTEPHIDMASTGSSRSSSQHHLMHSQDNINLMAPSPSTNSLQEENAAKLREDSSTTERTAAVVATSVRQPRTFTIHLYPVLRV